MIAIMCSLCPSPFSGEFCCKLRGLTNWSLTRSDADFHPQYISSPRMWVLSGVMASDRPRLDMETLERVAPLIRNVAHPMRLSILDYLQHEGEARTVSEIMEATGGTQAVISQHLRVLKDQQVLFFRRQGNYVLYGLADQSVLMILDCIRQHLGKRDR